MTIRYQSSHCLKLGASAAGLLLGRASRVRVGGAGWLAVQHGRVWITRDGGGDDLVLAAGAGVALPAGAGLVIEPWRDGEPVVLAWERAEGAVDRAATPLRRGAALGLQAVAARLHAAARGADAMAQRARGPLRPGVSA